MHCFILRAIPSNNHANSLLHNKHIFRVGVLGQNLHSGFRKDSAKQKLAILQRSCPHMKTDSMSSAKGHLLVPLEKASFLLNAKHPSIPHVDPSSFVGIAWPYINMQLSTSINADLNKVINNTLPYRQVD